MIRSDFVKVILVALLHACSGLHLRADFDQKDIRGFVKFGQHHTGSNLAIDFHFKANLRSFTNISFKVTKGPSIYDDWCANLGSVIHDLSATHGYIGYNSTFNDSSAQIIGRDSILGNSLTLYQNGTVIACSTILPDGKVKYATASISSAEIGGSFNFIQSGDSGANTFVYGDIRDNSVLTTARRYHVYVSADTADHKTCDPLHQVYNPTEQFGTCTTLQQSSCKIGDLSSKHGNLEVASGSSGILLGVDTNLPLAGSYSILSRYVVIKTQGDRVVGCGKINIAGPLEVVSTFEKDEHKGIHGTLTFSQQSPYHFTEFDTKLKGLGKRVKGYHVHRFPISDPANPCSGASVGGHVNTWKVDINDSPNPFNGSLDKYEVGDLSGRYGGLNDLEDYTYNTSDANLPLYGLYTILGRSIVIHENSGARFVCANIEPKDYYLKMSSTANFTGVKNSPVTGTVHSMQYTQKDGITTRTITIVDLKQKDGSKTTGHKWDMHEKPVRDNDCPSNSSSNPIYNPTNVAGNFCSEKTPFLCPIGDLSGKVGVLDLQLGKTFFSDENFPMFGELTSFGRSIVFYEAGKSNSPLACANIVPNEGRAVTKLEFDVRDNKTLKRDVDQLRGMLTKAFGFSAAQGYRINSLQTSDSKENDECFRTEFYMIDTNTPPNVAYYKCGLKDILNTTEKMKPFKWCPPSSAFVFVPSITLILLSVVGPLLI